MEDHDKGEKIGEKSRIDKPRTSDVEREKAGIDEYDLAGNVRERGEDPSPDDRDRGERSSAEPAGMEPTGGR